MSALGWAYVATVGAVLGMAWASIWNPAGRPLLSAGVGAAAVVVLWALLLLGGVR